jgi:hypothetical protein
MTFSNGITALVNEGSGTNKNLDCNIYHGMGLNIYHFKSRVLFSTTNAYTNITLDIDASKYEANSGSVYGTQFGQIDANQLAKFTAPAGIVLIRNDGSNASYSADNYFYNTILECII